MQAYENMKSRAKKAASRDKLERVKTGGGVFVSQVDEVDAKMLAVLGNRATPLFNPFDGDSVYNNESGMIIVCHFNWCKLDNNAA